MSTSGYSATPLARKLGIEAGKILLPKSPPPNYADLLAPLPSNVVFAQRLSPRIDIVHLFVDRRIALSRELKSLRHRIRPNAAIWVSWPKKSSKVPTDVTEATIRAIALPLGFVDIKVCAINPTWSALKLVIRKSLRPS